MRLAAGLMPGGSCTSLAELPAAPRAVVEGARRAVLSTVDADGRPHAVPICYALLGEEVVSAIDDKPKQGPELKRVRNLGGDPRAALLADRWDEDWSRLAWVAIRGEAHVGSKAGAWDVLVARYPQYADMNAASRFIVLRPERVVWWTYR